MSSTLRQEAFTPTGGRYKLAKATLSDGEQGETSLAADESTRVTIAGTELTGADAQHVIVDGGSTPTVKAALVADSNAAVSAAAGLRLKGYAVWGTTVATCTIGIVHGATVGAGTEIIRVTIAPNETTGYVPIPDGIAVASGLSIDHVAGVPTVALFTETRP